MQEGTIHTPAEKTVTAPGLLRRLAAEAVGTFFLLAVVIGSGIMGDRLGGGIDGIALLGNTAATGAILYVLITALGPISGAHFNPAVTLVMWLKREVTALDALVFGAVQTVFAVLGVVAAHLMFEIPLLQEATKIRAGAAQMVSEGIATFGLLFTILAVSAARREAVAAAVGLYITAGYWFTSSTSFANPAVTLARALSDTFAGIRAADIAPFIAAQIVGALLAWLLCRWLWPTE